MIIASLAYTQATRSLPQFIWFRLLGIDTDSMTRSDSIPYVGVDLVG